MKKICILLLLVLILAGCGNKSSKVDYSEEFPLKTYRCDMSGYSGLKSVGHNFEGTTVAELQRTIDEKGYGLFVLSRTDCPHCQQLMVIIDRKAKENNVTIYYLDADSNKYPILGTEYFDMLDVILKPIENVVDGEKAMQTPTFFSIINGELIDGQVGSVYKGTDPEASDIRKQEERYQQIIDPFKK